MSAETHSQIASFIWSICNLLRGPYKRNEYRKVILPLTVLRRFDCILVPTKDAVLKEHATIKAKPENIIRHKLCSVTGHAFYNLSKLDLARLLDDPNQLAPNLNSYINGFSPNVRAIMERFKFGDQIATMADKNLLYLVIKKFAAIDLSPARVDNVQMGYVFEELIRIGAEQSNEEAGEHFSPREVIKLMVNLLLSPEKDLARSHVVKTIYDPACGTGGMISVTDKHLRDLNADAQPKLFGQDWNDEAWAICKADMLIKGEDAENIILGDTFTKDGFDRDANGKKWTFDYMLANPPFGVEWKQQQRYIDNERDTLGHAGRFGAGTPRVNDGALLFLQHMISKMRAPQDGGSRIAIVFNGSPLFTGDAGGGESEIRRWIIENDWLEAIVALPEQLFYNTGISTYIWVLTNRKEKPRKGKVQLIDARQFWVQMEKSLGNKRRRIGDPSDKEKDPDHIGELTKICGNFRDGETRNFTEEDAITHQPIKRERVVSKIFDNEDFGYHKITVERPLRLNLQASAERIARLDDESSFKNLASSAKKDPAARQQEIEAGQQRQEQIRELLRAFGQANKEKLFKDRKEFLTELRKLDRARDAGLSAPELKAVLAALGERDETAEICRDRDGQPEPDTDLRDTETVPLKESIDEYFKREVLPHVPDAWIDTTKTKVGYEIPLNRHFYRYEPPRSLKIIEEDIARIETDVLKLLEKSKPPTSLFELIEDSKANPHLHDVFGVILFNELTPFVSKVLRDEDFWKALNSFSGPRWPIFAVRPKAEPSNKERPGGAGWRRTDEGPTYLERTLVKAIPDFDSPEDNSVFLDLFKVDANDLPMLYVFAEVKPGQLAELRCKFSAKNQDDCYNSLVEKIKSLQEAIAKVTDDNTKSTAEVFDLMNNEMKQHQIKLALLKGVSLIEKLKSFKG